jgi:hypothetical protein
VFKDDLATWGNTDKRAEVCGCVLGWAVKPGRLGRGSSGPAVCQLPQVARTITAPGQSLTVLLPP